MQGVVSASIVTYKNNPEILRKAILSFLNSVPDGTLYLIDNSPDDSARSLVSSPQIRYLHNTRNLGFGRAHNIALKEAERNGVCYHLVLNPDVYFDRDVIPNLVDFMEVNPEAGLVMPKVLYPDGRLQPLCKLLPEPSKLFMRRFFPGFKHRLNLANTEYEMRFTSYNEVTEAPFLSGCFMLLRKKVLEEIGGFDERFFLYFEDTDLSRRIHKQYKTVYYPKATIHHVHERGSHKDIRLFYHSIVSAFHYFTKWGWFKDQERDAINQSILQKYHINGYQDSDSKKAIHAQINLTLDN